MLIKVFAISTTQVKKSGRPLTLQAGSVVELDTSIGDTYSKRACRVVGQNATVTVDAPEKKRMTTILPVMMSLTLQLLAGPNFGLLRKKTASNCRPN